MVLKNILLAAIMFGGTILALPEASEEKITGTESVCKEVDFETLRANQAPGEFSNIGPGGFFLETPSGCLFTSLDEPTVQQKYPTNFKLWHQVMNAINDELVQSGKSPASILDVDSTPGCGQA